MCLGVIFECKEGKASREQTNKQKTLVNGHFFQIVTAKPSWVLWIQSIV